MLKVYGASDDLIEIEGDFSAEVNDTQADGTKVLAFSDGSMIEVNYNEAGLWHFDIRIEGTSKPKKTFWATDSDGDNYSDIIEFEGTVAWAVYGERAS